MPIAISISGTGGTFPSGTYVLSPPIISSQFASVQINSLTFGPATFISTTGPAGSYGVLIEPPPSNITVLTLKGITTDTGIPISPSLPTLLTFSNPAVPNTIGLLSGGASITGVVTLTWF